MNGNDGKIFENRNSIFRISIAITLTIISSLFLIYFFILFINSSLKGDVMDNYYNRIVFKTTVIFVISFISIIGIIILNNTILNCHLKIFKDEIEISNSKFSAFKVKKIRILKKDIKSIEMEKEIEHSIIIKMKNGKIFYEMNNRLWDTEEPITSLSNWLSGTLP